MKPGPSCLLVPLSSVMSFGTCGGGIEGAESAQNLRLEPRRSTFGLFWCVDVLTAGRVQLDEDVDGGGGTVCERNLTRTVAHTLFLFTASCCCSRFARSFLILDVCVLFVSRPASLISRLLPSVSTSWSNTGFTPGSSDSDAEKVNRETLFWTEAHR